MQDLTITAIKGGNSIRKCFVSWCSNSSVNSPNKIFFPVPTDVEELQNWYRTVNYNIKPEVPKYCCQDHFETEDILVFLMPSTGMQWSLKRKAVPKCGNQKSVWAKGPSKECYISTCAHTFSNTENMIFFNVPTDCYQLLYWLEAVNYHIKPGIPQYCCKDHFYPDDILVILHPSSGMQCSLREKAVPKKFSQPPWTRNDLTITPINNTPMATVPQVPIITKQAVPWESVNSIPTPTIILPNSTNSLMINPVAQNTVIMSSAGSVNPLPMVMGNGLVRNEPTTTSATPLLIQLPEAVSSVNSLPMVMGNGLAQSESATSSATPVMILPKTEISNVTPPSTTTCVQKASETIVLTDESSSESFREEPRNRKIFKTCFVPRCKNRSGGCSGMEKIFITIPFVKDQRDKWFNAVNKSQRKIPSCQPVYCCLDHFDIDNDFADVSKINFDGGLKALKPGVIPHVFSHNDTSTPIKKSQRIKSQNVIYAEELNNTEEKICFVPSCQNISTRILRKHFFKVPLISHIREKWCKSVNRVLTIGEEFQTLYCCSDHFLEHDLVYNSDMNVGLRNNACPLLLKSPAIGRTETKQTSPVKESSYRRNGVKRFQQSTVIVSALIEKMNSKLHKKDGENSATTKQSGSKSAPPWSTKGRPKKKTQVEVISIDDDDSSNEQPAMEHIDDQTDGFTNNSMKEHEYDPKLMSVKSENLGALENMNSNKCIGNAFIKIKEEDLSTEENGSTLEEGISEKQDGAPDTTSDKVIKQENTIEENYSESQINSAYLEEAVDGVENGNSSTELLLHGALDTTSDKVIKQENTIEENISESQINSEYLDLEDAVDGVKNGNSSTELLLHPVKPEVETMFETVIKAPRNTRIAPYQEILHLDHHVKIKTENEERELDPLQETTVELSDFSVVKEEPLFVTAINEFEQNNLEENNQESTTAITEPNKNNLNALNLDNSTPKGGSDVYKVGDFELAQNKNVFFYSGDKFEDILTPKESPVFLWEYNLMIYNAQISLYKDIAKGRNRRVEGGIRCPHCPKSVRTFKSFKAHLYVRHTINTNSHKCPLCDFTTKLESAVRAHMKKVHQKTHVGTYICELCGKTLNSTRSLNRHRNLLHNIGKKFKCGLCKYHAYNKSALRKHVGNKHPVNQSWSCVYCDYTCDTKKLLSLHKIKEHKNQCDSCHLCFMSSLELYSHKQVEHTLNPIIFNCSNCSFNDKRKELVIIHGNVDHRFVDQFSCDQCKFVATTLEHFSKHLHTKHNPFKPSLELYCYHCNYKAYSKARMAIHMNKHYHKSQHLYKCKKCKYSTMIKPKLIQHLNNKHNPNPVYYHCYHCSYASKIKWKLAQHMQEKRKENHLLV